MQDFSLHSYKKKDFGCAGGNKRIFSFFNLEKELDFKIHNAKVTFSIFNNTLTIMEKMKELGFLLVEAQYDIMLNDLLLRVPSVD